MTRQPREWCGSSYFLDLDIGVVHVGDRPLVNIDLAIGRVYLGEGNLLKSIKQSWLN
jgi:hypothetical protein